MINKKLIILTSAGLFLVTAPVVSQQIPGNEIVPKSEKVATVPKNDTDVTNTIKDTIKNNHELAKEAANVNIKTENGKVTLSGKVDDQDTKDDIETIAKDVAGDNNVVNNITVTD